jgi:hypothetical protein
VGERASCESEYGRGALSCGTRRGRGVPVEGASYESEPERDRGTPSSWPRTRRTWYAVEAGCLLLWLSRFVFLLSLDVGTHILLVPTQSVYTAYIGT